MSTAATTVASPPTAGLGRWGVLTGAIIVQLILGTVYGYSIFWQPLEADVGLAPSQANYAFSICILAFALTMVIAGRVQDITGPRFPALIGAGLMGGGFILASFMHSPAVLLLAHSAMVGAAAIVLMMLFHAFIGRRSAHESPIVRYVPMGIAVATAVAGVVLGNQYVGKLGDTDRLLMLWGTVGLLAGMGIGFAYVCPIAALVKWFPNAKGLVAGVAVAGFGFGAFIFANKDLAFSAENFIQEYGITRLFLIHGVVSLVGIGLGALLLRNPPELPTPAAAARKDTSQSNWQDTLRRPAFYMLWIMFFSGAMAGLMVIGILKGFAGSQLVEAAGGASAVTQTQHAELLARGVSAVWWLAIFNAVGRVVWGLASDKIGRTTAFVAMFVFQAVVLFLLGGLQTEMSLAIGASLIGFNYGGIFALFPSATADLFGAKNLGANYGWLFTSYGIAGVVGIAAWNAAKEHASPTTAFTIAAVLCLISAALAIALALAQRRASD